MDAKLVALYHRHVAAAYDRQLRLGDFLERETNGANWHYQVSTSTLSFGPSVKFQANDLGSHSTLDNSWLWGWYSSQTNLTAAMNEFCEAIRGLGSRHDIRAFLLTQPFDVGAVLGTELGGIASHVFGIITSGELGYQAYYNIPYKRGRSTVLLRDDRLRVTEPAPLARVATIFPQVLAGFPITDQRAALIGYLASYDITPEASGRLIRVVEGGVESLRAEFDEQHRLSNLTGAFQNME